MFKKTVIKQKKKKKDRYQQRMANNGPEVLVI
jgi:hypothetical protein